MMALWIDSPDARERIADMDLLPHVRAALLSLIENGVAVLKQAHSPTLCDAVVDDYKDWSAQNSAYVQENLDAMGRPKRLVNFHLHSDNALAIGTSEHVHEVLDAMFGMESSLYTSLAFAYGSQQPVHRDTPHFATWPSSYFAGAWTALEDVQPEAGPLFYHPGAHRVPVRNPSVIMQEAIGRLPQASLDEQLWMALDLYNGEVSRAANAFCDPVSLCVSQGDTVIWHPEAPHGGLHATDQMRTRWSLVCHCAPTEVQVFQHPQFFQHEGPAAPAPRYGFRKTGTRSVALAGEVAFM